MSKPCCKLEIYDTSDDAVYAGATAITTDVVECTTRDFLTAQPGSFSFMLPATKAFANTYLDIGNNYKAKISFGYDGSYTHMFTGKILPFKTQVRNGFTRSFQGKSLSEILERRFKYNKRWQNTSAHDIVDDVATDLSLTSDIDASATVIPLTVKAASYFDILTQVSDYWIDATHKVTMDFGVDKDNSLFWKAKPLRNGLTAPVYGTDFTNYDLTYDILPIKNYITVYGAAKTFYPTDQDSLTEALTGWAAADGGSIELSVDHQVGTYSVRIYNGGNAILTLTKTVTCRDIDTLTFKYKPQAGLAGCQIRLHAPDADNYFLADLENNSDWTDFSERLGEENEYDAVTGLGTWKNGDGYPNWWDIQAIKFVSNTNPICIDNLYFSPDRQSHTASDATSISAYGQREAEYTDDNLITEDECEARAETILYQQKNRLIRLDLTIKGSTSYFPGDRLTMTLPPDDVTDLDFDVVAVAHDYSQAGYYTTLSMIDTSLTRLLPATSPLERLQQADARNRMVFAWVYSKMAR